MCSPIYANCIQQSPKLNDMYRFADMLCREILAIQTDAAGGGLNRRSYERIDGQCQEITRGI